MPAASPSADSKNLRILVVDDNEAIHEDFRKILCAQAGEADFDAEEAAMFGDSGASSLTSIQFEMSYASQGKQALEMVQAAAKNGKRYAMVFMDVRMPPGWDGLETTVKLWEVDPDLQVVICTAYSDKSWEEMMETVSNIDRVLILKKPFDSMEVLQLAHALTEKWSLVQASRRNREELEQTVSQRTQELKSANALLEIQYAVSRVLEESSTAARPVPKILEAVCAHFGWEIGKMWMVDRRRQVLSCVEVWSSPNSSTQDVQRLSKEQTFDRGVGLPGRVWATAQTAWVAEAGKNGHSAPSAGASHETGAPYAAFALPVLIGSEVAGVVEFFSRELQEPDGELLRTLAMVGSQLGQFFQRRELQENLFQSQKMETVGKLAGGVAHEFNTLLTAIIGRSDLIQRELHPESSLAANVAWIRKSADQAAGLTRQLLAFGRGQFLHPQLLNLNSAVARLDGMLRHILGGGIEVITIQKSGLAAVKVDPGQLDQIIMNIAVNARDAMTEGGKLTVETSTCVIENHGLGGVEDIEPGEYAVLSISDTGRGMSAEVREQIFEPFFTTKSNGSGTGLGLAMCFGIVKQSGGHITVDSEPGRGATFKIYLPIDHSTGPLQPESSAGGLPQGTETILLIENNHGLRNMASMLLNRLGYSVLAADNSDEATDMLKDPVPRSVDLLITDTSTSQAGTAVSEYLLLINPSARILYTANGSGNDISEHTGLKKAAVYLQKPFAPNALAMKVREILDH